MPASTTEIRRACARSMMVERLRVSSASGQAAQAVVAAERHDEHPHVAVERPVEPRQAAGGRVAGDARIDDGVSQPGVLDPILQHGGIGVLHGQTQAGGQAVAEHDHPRRAHVRDRRQRLPIGDFVATVRSSVLSPRVPHAAQSTTSDTRNQGTARDRRII